MLWSRKVKPVISTPDDTAHQDIVLAQTGDAAAFTRLVRAHQGAVRLYARRLCGGRDDLADDMAQETFLTAHRKLRSFKGQGSFEGWLKRITTTQFLMAMRTDKRHKRLKDGLTAEGEALDQHRLQPSKYAGEKADLDKALGHLAEAERLCVVLCYAGEYSHAEAAQLTGMPLGTVKSHVTRGVKKLKTLLSADQSQKVSS